MPRIIKTRQTDDDLIAIWLGIAADNPETADRVLDAIERHWQQLSRYAYSGIAREDIGAGIRHLVAGQYLTLYRISAEGVEIIRAWHGKQKISRDSIR